METGNTWYLKWFVFIVNIFATVLKKNVIVVTVAIATVGKKL